MAGKFTKASARRWAKLYAGDLLRSFLDSDPVEQEADGSCRDIADALLLIQAMKELADQLSPLVAPFSDAARDERAQVTLGTRGVPVPSQVTKKRSTRRTP